MTRTRIYRFAWRPPGEIAALIQSIAGQWEDAGYAVMSSAVTVIPPEDVQGTATPPQAVWSFGVGWMETLEESA